MTENAGRICFVVILYFAVSALVSLAAGQIAGEGYPETHSTLITGISSLIMIPLCILLMRKWLIPFCPGKRNPVLFKFIIILAAACSGAALSLLYGRISELLRFTHYFSDRVQEDLFSADLPEQIIVLGLLSPLSEELLFRGIIFGNCKRMMPETAGALLTSALFTLLHLNPIQMIYAFPMALVMQLFFHLEGSLTAPLVFHIGANLTSVLVRYCVH